MLANKEFPLVYKKQDSLTVMSKLYAYRDQKRTYSDFNLYKKP